MTTEKRKINRKIPEMRRGNITSTRIAWNRREWGERWGFCMPTVDKLLRSGDLPHLRVGARVVISQEDEQAFIENTRVKVKA